MKTKVNSLADYLKLNVDKPKKERKKSTKIAEQSEHESQCQLFEWAEQSEGRYPELCLFYAIPNGAGTPYARYKDKKTGKTFAFSKERAKLVSEGLKSGVPDTHLPVSRGIYHSLYIEMKRHPNKASDNQLKWHEKLRKFSNYVAICWNFDEARELILRYLGLGTGEAI